MNLFKHTFALLLALGLCPVLPAVDNAKLLPPIVDDSLVRMEPAADDPHASPDWVKNLIIVEAYVGSASPDGKFSGMTAVLDHLAEMGVNGLWLTPINEGYQYGNHGIHTLNSGLTGETDIPRRWQAVRKFVDEAHRRNIRVFLDAVTWGVDKRAPLLKERPDWFTEPIPRYRGWAWDWNSAELNEWFASRLTELILLTGVDGVRCDCAPFYAKYKPYRVAKERLRQMGRKIIFISEHASGRFGVFDFDQLGFVPENGKPRLVGDVFLHKNIVDMTRSGDELIARDMDRPAGTMRYYTFQLSSHDTQQYVANGSPVAFGYQMIFAPFIPIWYIGEEWNNAYSRKVPPKWLFANDISWQQKDQPANRAFFDLVKRMIRIRREHPDIFEYFPANHRESNICKVRTDRADLLQPYARFRNGKTILIVPNNGKTAARIRVELPECAAEAAEVRDLLAGKTIAAGKPGSLKTFEVELPADSVGVYLAAGK